MTASLLSVAIADDDPQARDIYSTLVSSHDGFRLVGVASDGRAAVDLFRQHHPDVMLMDLLMPVMSGVEAMRIIRAEDPAACIVALTTQGSPDRITFAFAAGAAGYLLKGSRPDDVVRAIMEAQSGECPLSWEVRHTLARFVQHNGMVPPVAINSPLSPRQATLIQLLSRGFTNQEIASQMHISVGSVKKYLTHIGHKLGVSGRVHILIAASQAGLIDVSHHHEH